MDKVGTFTLPITWHSATERPGNYRDVVVILKHPELQGQINVVMSVIYHDGHFNGKHSFDNEVVCWAYEDSFYTAFHVFGGDRNEKDTTGCSSGISAEVR